MYEITELVYVTDPADPHLVTELVERVTAAVVATGAHTSVVAPTLPGVRNGGDLVVHLQFGSEEQWRRVRADVDAAISGTAVARVNSVEYHGANIKWPTAYGRRIHTVRPSVYRTLLLRVDESATPAQVDDFERALLRMPRHISAIRAWKLSHVSRAGGDSRWTHVWEQEFTDLEGLLGEYMDHPIHWASVDPFFDPENPACIVRDRVCHSFCLTDHPVVTAAVPARPNPEPSAGGVLLAGHDL